MWTNYKVHVIDKNNIEAYPLPCIEKTFSKISGAEYFVKIDLSSAYWQIALEEESQEVSTTHTTWGFFRVTRLQQGLENAATIFQQVIDEKLKGLTGCIAYQDDIFLYGATDVELRQRQNAVVERLKSKKFTVNDEDCVSFNTFLPFLGYEVSSDGVKPDPKHTDKLLQLQSPRNLKEVETSIALIHYFGWMIPNYAAKTRFIKNYDKKTK